MDSGIDSFNIRRITPIHQCVRFIGIEAGLSCRQRCLALHFIAAYLYWSLAASAKSEVGIPGICYDLFFGTYFRNASASFVCSDPGSTPLFFAHIQEGVMDNESAMALQRSR